MTAVIVTQPEMSVPALVMNCLAPSTTHSPSSSLAVVRVLPASEPASGSVRPKAASLRAGGQLRHPLGLLLVRAPEVDRHRAERGVGGHRDRHRGVDPGQLLDRERVGERVGAAAPVLLRERDAHQAELAHLRDELVGKRLGAVELLGDRRHLVAGEVAHGVAQQPLLVGEVEVHGAGSLGEGGRRQRRPDFAQEAQAGRLSIGADMTSERVRTASDADARAISSPTACDGARSRPFVAALT